GRRRPTRSTPSSSDGPPVVGYTRGGRRLPAAPLPFEEAPVFTSPARAGLFLCAAALAVSAGTAQPPEGKRTADGTPKAAAPEKVAAPPPALPALPALAADAPPLRRVRHEQVREGLAY